MRSVEGQRDGMSHERVVVLVQFQSADPESCLRCMVTHMELFYVFGLGDDIFGYMWMTQTEDDILGGCLEPSLCAKL